MVKIKSRNFSLFFQSYNAEELAVFEIVLEAFNTFIEVSIIHATRIAELIPYVPVCMY